MKELTNHGQFNDQEFLAVLEDVTMPPELFSHEAHLRMAWLYIHNNSKSEALKKASAAIRGLDNKHAGGKNYHHTKTVAFIRLIGSIMNRKPCQTWQLFLLSNRNFVFSKKTLEFYYSESILNSAGAREQFIEPDIHPLPDF